MAKRGRPRTAKQYTPQTAPERLSVPDVDFGGTFNNKLAEPPGGSADRGAARHGDSSRVAPKLIAPPSRKAERDIRQDATALRLDRLISETGYDE
tara:strand:- start:1627 stop:1911 length:285 start_codon:yes stop_codon:yes gene_type:complete